MFRGVQFVVAKVTPYLSPPILCFVSLGTDLIFSYGEMCFLFGTLYPRWKLLKGVQLWAQLLVPKLIPVRVIKSHTAVRLLLFRCWWRRLLPRVALRFTYDCQMNFQDPNTWQTDTEVPSMLGIRLQLTQFYEEKTIKLCSRWNKDVAITRNGKQALLIFQNIEGFWISEFEKTNLTVKA